MRTMISNRAFTALVALSLALGIGANVAIYSFMDSILLRPLPVSDPASLAVLNWRSKPAGQAGKASPSVMHAMSGSAYRRSQYGNHQRHFPLRRIRAFPKKRYRFLQPVRLLPLRKSQPDDQWTGRRHRR